MENLVDILYYYLKKQEVADEKFIKFCFKELVNKFDVYSYIQQLEIDNYKSNFLSRYLPHTKTLYINYQKLIYMLSSDIVNNNSINDYQKRLYTLNLLILKVLFHELEHANQEKKKHEVSDTLESNILFLSNKCDIYLKNSNIVLYRTKLYYLSPIERSAELTALENAMELCRLYNDFQIDNYFENYYYQTCNYGYEKQARVIVSPFDTYTSKCDIIKEGQQLRNLIFENCTLDFKKLYGLKLTEEEYNKIHYVKNIGGKNESIY